MKLKEIAHKLIFSLVFIGGGFALWEDIFGLRVLLIICMVWALAYLWMEG